MIGVALKPVEVTVWESLKMGMNDLGYDIVRVQMQGQERPVLEIIIDRLDQQNVGIEDCVRASNYASTVLDVVDPFSGKYTLQIFSPGSDRPLTRPEDFERFLGCGVKIKLLHPLEGRKRWLGQLMRVNDVGVELQLDDMDNLISLPFADIMQAQLAPDWEQKKDQRRNNRT